MTGVPLDDRGLLLGDGLFETVLFRAGAPVLWAEHEARLQRSCTVLGLPAPEARTLAAAAAQAVRGAGLGQARAAVRLTWTAGSGARGLARPDPVAPRLFAAAAASPRPQTPARLATSAIRRNASSPASRLKTLSYVDNVLARREAAQAGADEALMLSTEGHLASASAANLFWIADGRLCTPGLGCGILDGVMRSRVLAVAVDLGIATEQMACGPDALAQAEAVFLTSSLLGVRPVNWLDGRDLGPHALVMALANGVLAWS